MSEAAAALQAADADVAARAEALQLARAAFEAEPSDAAESAIEVAERDLRKAERWRDARAIALKVALAAEREAQKSEARARRSELSNLHEEARASLGALIASFGELYEQLNALVDRVDEVIQRDAALCEEHNELGHVAGSHEQLAPLEAEIIRLAVGLYLAENWDDSPEDSPHVDLKMARGELARALRSPDTNEGFYFSVQRAQQAIDHAFGSAPLNRWLAVAPPPGHEGPQAERTRRAAALLQMLEEKTP